MADSPQTVLLRHHRRIYELRKASRQARREHSPTGNALVGHLRLERELTSDLLATEAAVTASQTTRVEALAMLEAVAIASRSHAAAHQAETTRRALEASQPDVTTELTDVLARAPTEVKRHLLRVLEQDLDRSNTF